MLDPSAEPSNATFDQAHQTVQGDQTNVAGDLNLNTTHYNYWLERQSALLNEPSADLFWLTAGRSDEIAQLNAWYDNVLTDQRGKHPRTVILTGAAGIGKHELVQRWCVACQTRDQAPIIAQSTYLPPYYAESQQETYYASQPRLQAAWAAYAGLLRARYEEAEVLGGRGWLALAAQVIEQSPRARAAFHNALPSPTAPDAATVRRHMNELFVNALSDGPLVLVIEQVDNGPTTLQLLIDGWNKMLYNLPFLLVLLVHRPQPLHQDTAHEQVSDWLRWLRQRAAPYATQSFPTLHVEPLRRQAIAALLSADAAAYAGELHGLTAGVPDLLRELLRHWEQQGLAHQQPDERWQLATPSLATFPGALYERYIESPLQRCAARAQALGFDVTAELLLDWLNYAVWEGDTFTDAALAHAVGQQGEAWDDFRDLLNEVLSSPEAEPDPATLLVELEELIILPTAELERRERGLARYRFHPPLLARLLYWRQSAAEQAIYGPRYIQALIAAYHPFEVQIAPLLIHLAHTLGRSEDAARFQQWIAPPEDLARAQLRLATLRALATDPPGQQHFVRAVLEFFTTFYLKVHPRPFIPLLGEAVDYARTLHQTYNQAWLLNNLGLVYAHLGDNAQALAFYQQALPLLRQVGDLRGEAYTLNNLGLVYAALGNNAQALALYQQALPLVRQVGDIGGEANTLTHLGLVYAHLGDNAQAPTLYQQALPLWRQIGDLRGEAATLTYLGNVYAHLGDNTQALALHQQALPLVRQVGDLDGEATTLTNLGNLYANLGDNAQALAFYQQALPLLRQVGDLRGEAYTLTNLGLVYAALGDNAQALALYQQALPLRRQVGDLRGEAYTLTHLGAVYADLGDNAQALALYQQALPLRRQVGDRRGEATTLTHLGAVYAALGDKAQALALYQQALPLRRQVGDLDGEATTLTNLGNLYASLGDKAQARGCWQQALPLFEKVRSPDAALVREKLATLE